MYNLPTNNETNIIRNIFNVSAQLNESKSLKEATNATYGQRVSQAADETGGHVDPRAVEFSPEEQEGWAKKAKMMGTNINVIRAEEINKASDKARQDKRAKEAAKEAEESHARVKAWQSSPEYKKQVEADRAKAAARKDAQQVANVVRQREQPESTAAKVDAAITTAATAVGLPGVGETISGALGIDAASRREAAIEAEGAKATERQKIETNKPEYIAKQTEDFRMLPELVRQGKISQEQAEEKLQQHVKTRGGHDDTSKHIEKTLNDWKNRPVHQPTELDMATAAFKTTSLGKGLDAIKSGWNWITGSTDVYDNPNKSSVVIPKSSSVPPTAARKAPEATQDQPAWYNPRGWFGESAENHYYTRLANLFEETRVSDEPMSGMNPAAYGYTPKGQRKARLAAARFNEPMANWASDSTTEAPDLEPESTERPHIDTVVAPHIETLVRAAAQNEIDLSHGEAFDPRSKDHQRLIIKTKDPEVMKASEAIRQIRKDYGIED